MRDTNQEYARLTTEASRKQWEAIGADNFRRSQASADELKARAGLAQMNEAAQNMAAGERLLFSEWTAATKDVKPDETEWTLPLDKLKDIANTGQKLTRLTGFDPGNPQQPQPQQPIPDTFPDGQAVHVMQNQDGTLHVEYATGEKFDGDALTVPQRIGRRMFPRNGGPSNSGHKRSCNTSNN